MSDQEIEKQINKALKQAVAFHQSGQLQQASSIYRQLLRINPNQADILHLLGLACYQMGVYGEAVALIGRAVEVHPNVSSYHNHLGSALFALGKRDTAILQFKQAVQCANPAVDAYHNLGVALYDDGQWKESIAIYEKGLKRYPGEGLLLNEVLKNMAEACMWGSAFESYKSQLLERAKKAVSQNKPSPLSPYHALCISDDARLQQSVAQLTSRKVEDQVKSAKQQLGFTFEKGHKPSGLHHALRIGYVSADFRDHPTAHLIGHMLEMHDKEQVEVFAYALGEGDNSPYRERIKNACTHFMEAANMPLHQLAQQIYRDKVDILIDVMGYISGAQPELFALRPAPLNISFLAYPGTMGATFMDYLVVDKVALSDARQITESPFYMPHSYFVSDMTLTPSEPKTRQQHGLPEKSVVLGCFNKPSKMTEAIFAVWCDILKATPNAVLWLYAPNDFTKENLQQQALKYGVEAERIIFAAKTDKAAHLARYTHVDLFLDCSPVTAHTTAIDALSMGVPVVTIKGKTMISRASASILSAAGLEDLLCKDIKAYQQKIIDLLQDKKALDAVTQQVVSAKQSPMFDTKAYTKQFEMGLHQAFSRWMDGEAPDRVECYTLTH